MMNIRYGFTAVSPGDVPWVAASPWPPAVEGVAEARGGGAGGAGSGASGAAGTSGSVGGGMSSGTGGTGMSSIRAPVVPV